MSWKPFAAIGVFLLGLTLLGLFTRADGRLVAADAFGALGAGVVAVLVYRGGQLAVAMPGVVAVTLLVTTLLAVTSHQSLWLVALTLAGVFAFGFVSISGRGRKGFTGPAPQPR